jgi:hypothetical protein
MGKYREAKFVATFCIHINNDRNPQTSDNKPSSKRHHLEGQIYEKISCFTIICGPVSQFVVSRFRTSVESIIELSLYLPRTRRRGATRFTYCGIFAQRKNCEAQPSAVTRQWPVNNNKEMVFFYAVLPEML